MTSDPAIPRTPQPVRPTGIGTPSRGPGSLGGIRPDDSAATGEQRWSRLQVGRVRPVLAAMVVVSAGDLLSPRRWPCHWSLVGWCSRSHMSTLRPSSAGTRARSAQSCGTSGPLRPPRCRSRRGRGCGLIQDIAVTDEVWVALSVAMAIGEQQLCRYAAVRNVGLTGPVRARTMYAACADGSGHRGVAARGRSLIAPPTAT